MDHSLVAKVIIVAAFVAAVFLADGISRDYAVVTLHVGSETRTFEGEVSAGMVVLDGLNAAAVAGGIPLQFSLDERQATHILALGSSHPTQDQILILLNGQRIPVDQIATTLLKAHDRVEVTAP